MVRLLPVGFLLLIASAAAQAQQSGTPVADSLRTHAEVTSAPADSTVRIIRFSAPFTTVQPELSHVAGVQVTPYSGAPGAGAVVRIRGAASLDSHVQPLYVVDGVPVFQYRFRGPSSGNTFPSQAVIPDASTNPLLSIVPEDIERIEILKGAFETGQYGFVGQNGVIKITTRRGAAGQPLRVQYTGLGGVQTARKHYDLLGAREAADLANEVARADNYPDEYTPAQLAGLGAGTDWQSEVLRTAAMQEHHLGLSGGTAHGTRYATAVDYLNQQGIVLNTGLQRYSLRLNLDQDIGKRLHLSAGISYGQVAERRPDAALMAQTLRFVPTVPVHDANGDYSNDYGGRNPVQIANQNLSTARNRRLLAYTELRYELAPGLTLDLRVALERDSLSARDYQGPSQDYAPRDGFETGVRSANYRQVVLNPALRYARTLGHGHALTASVEANSWKSRQTESSAEYAVPAPPFNLPPRNNAGSESSTGNALLSYQLQAGYTYAERYAVQGSLRADNSSLMPASQRNQWLPAAQATWHAAKENWLPSRATISTLDIWAGWGQTSNRANFAAEHYFTYILPNTLIHEFLDERTTQADAGLTLGLWHDRLTITANGYRRVTRATRIFPGQLGDPEALDLTNRGLELALTGRWQRGRLSGSTSIAASYNRNQYDKPAGSQALDFRPAPYYFTVTPGQPLSSFIGYRYLGVDAVGQPRFEGEANGSPAHQQILGNGLPRQLLNFTQDLHYGRFDLQVQVDGMFGYDVFDPNLSLLDLPYGGFNATTRVRDRWTPTHTSTDVPRAGTQVGNFSLPNTYTLQSGNHIRLSSVLLSAEVWRQNPHSVSVFLSGTNLLVLTRYRGYDPSVSSAEADPRQAGLDQATYPTARTVALGVRATF